MDTILLIEDEPKAAQYLCQGLTESGYTVEAALDGTDGLHAAITGNHDLVILDVMLPGIDGFALLTALRMSKQTPVLMLTARGRTDDKLRGFDLGADDYLVKPFQFPELLARVRALLKRGQPPATDPVMHVADLELDPVRHRPLYHRQLHVDAAAEPRPPGPGCRASSRGSRCSDCCRSSQSSRTGDHRRCRTAARTRRRTRNHLGRRAAHLRYEP